MQEDASICTQPIKFTWTKNVFCPIEHSLIPLPTHQAHASPNNGTAGQNGVSLKLEGLSLLMSLIAVDQHVTCTWTSCKEVDSCTVVRKEAIGFGEHYHY